MGCSSITPPGRRPLPRFAADSTLERNGFELPVPRQIGNGFVGSFEFDRSTGAPVIRAVAGLGIPIELSGTVRGAATHRPIRRLHTTAALSAVQARRGTEGSNPFPLSGRRPGPRRVQTVAATFAVSPSFVVKPQAWRWAAQPQDGDAARRRSSGTGVGCCTMAPIAEHSGI
jgi:hypothetical protein